MRVPDPLPVNTIKYENFKGVDFTSQIPDRQHFPVGKNFVIDKDGCHKRFGYYRTKNISVSDIGQKINGLYKYQLAGIEKYLIHAGTKLYKSNSDFSTATVISDVTITDAKSNGRAYNDCFILATGEEWTVIKNRKLNDNTALVAYTVQTSDFDNSFCVVDFDEYIVHHSYTLKAKSDPLSESYDITLDGGINGDYHREDGQIVFYNTSNVKNYVKGKTVQINDTTDGISVYYYNVPANFYFAKAVSEFAFGHYAYLSGSDVLPIKDGAQLTDCFYSYEDNAQYRFTVNIPDNYISDTIYIPYLTSDAISAADLQNENRFFENILVINDTYARGVTGEQLMNIYSILSLPTIFEDLTFFRSNTAASDTWTYDKIVTEYGGSRTIDEYNIVCPYVAYSGKSYQNSFNNSSSGFIDGYVITEKEGFGSQYAFFVFEDGSVFDACVHRRKISSIQNYVSSDPKKDLYLTFVNDREVYNYPPNVPSSKIGLPFKILIVSETAYNVFIENKIWKCKVFETMQYGNGIYCFMTRNSEFPNRDWHSAINDPLNIPATAYTIYGANDRIVGYGMYGSSLAVLKESAENDKLYLRSANYVDGLGVTFLVSVGIGNPEPALSGDSIKNLSSEMLYLSENGIYAITSLSQNAFTVTRCRSFYINGMLNRESGRSEAISCVYDGRLLTAVGNKIYVLDGNLPKDYISETDGEYSYQGSLWDGLPNIKCFCVLGDVLFFGDDSGNIWRFADGNTDARYQYRDRYVDSENTGIPVNMTISTRMDDDGDFMMLKKIMKKGSGMLVKPYRRSTFSVGYRYDNLNEVAVRTDVHADIFDFNDIDFEDFSFVGSGDHVVLPFLKKSKKYKALQIFVKSENDEPFSLLGIIKRFTINNYVKR